MHLAIEVPDRLTLWPMCSLAQEATLQTSFCKTILMEKAPKLIHLPMEHYIKHPILYCGFR